MERGIFIAGTDTGVGKTVLSALLTAALGAIYWKPVQSGACEGTDRRAVLRWAEIPEDKTRPEIYCFDPPVSPHAAAREAGIEINLRHIPRPQAEDGALWVVESAGGIMTPLNGRETMLDLARHLRLPVIVASRTTLGTINHTLLTLAALRHAEIELRGVVMLGHENVENRRAIEHYGHVQVIGHVPWLASINRQALLDIFEAEFDKGCFR